MLKYIAVKVFVTDGLAEKTAWEQKSLMYADRLGSLPLWAKTAFFAFCRAVAAEIENNLNGDIL
jgi:hypothetical protein